MQQLAPDPTTARGYFIYVPKRRLVNIQDQVGCLTLYSALGAVYGLPTLCNCNTPLITNLKHGSQPSN